MWVRVRDDAVWERYKPVLTLALALTLILTLTLTLTHNPTPNPTPTLTQVLEDNQLHDLCKSVMQP